MANDIKLQEGHPVDENLRPIKVGGKSTAIETAQHGNGARIVGDLEVTGDIKGNIKDMVLEDVTLDSLTTNSIVSTNLTIDDSGDITLDSVADIVLDALPTTESYVLLDSTSAAGADIEDHIISELDKIPMGIERGATGGTGSSLPIEIVHASP